MNTKQEQHQPSNNSTNQALFSHNICSLCKLKNAGYTFRPNAVYKDEEPRSANGNSAFRSSKTRHWEWRFPAHLGCLACTFAAAAAAADWRTDQSKRQYHWRHPVKSPTVLALSSSRWQVSTMHELANCNGASHAGYVPKEHPLGNSSRTALVWEILCKRIPNRKMCPQKDISQQQPICYCNVQH